jgi:sterol desaturase/sphingolipid hydroxylase (fatty acid hydroxylase superfamily)
LVQPSATRETIPCCRGANASCGVAASSAAARRNGVASCAAMPVRVACSAARKPRRSSTYTPIHATTGAGVLWLSAVAATRQWRLLALTGLPDWAAISARVLLLDLTDYGRHRLSHRVPVLWRLHRVHHSDVAVDVTTSLRNHPIEMLLRPLFIAGAVLVFGIAPLALLLQPVLQLPILVFEDANIRLPPALDRALAWLIVTPGMHLVHHSNARRQTDSNYATLLSVWDRLLGSFTPTSVPPKIGIDGFDQPGDQTIVGMLATAWR